MNKKNTNFTKNPFLLSSMLLRTAVYSSTTRAFMSAVARYQEFNPRVRASLQGYVLLICLQSGNHVLAPHCRSTAAENSDNKPVCVHEISTVLFVILAAEQMHLLNRCCFNNEIAI